MNSVWQLQEAKSRLSELVQSAQKRGAQTITKHGRPVAVVLSAEAYSQLQPRPKIVDVLRECPDPGLLVERLRDTPRPLEL
ncbi:MAG: type II toxin-antitoxin system Phd/YefM family antitoxin [Chthoniobacteraceae bacterium]